MHFVRRTDASIVIERFGTESNFVREISFASFFFRFFLYRKINHMQRDNYKASVFTTPWNDTKNKDSFLIVESWPMPLLLPHALPSVELRHLLLSNHSTPLFAFFRSHLQINYLVWLISIPILRRANETFLFPFSLLIICNAFQSLY